jgi:hypothetical protein
MSDEPHMHPNKQMQKYQILAAGETVDLVYFGGGDASLGQAGSAEFSDGWVHIRDGGGNRISYPARRVEYVQHDFDVPEVGE